jgi:hypothetical protein
MNQPPIAPLLDVFQELRRRQFPLGVAEYVAALQALQAGFGQGSRERLLVMCEALWARSEEEREQVADILHALLPPPQQGPEVDVDLPSDGAGKISQPTALPPDRPSASVPDPASGSSVSPSRSDGSVGAGTAGALRMGVDTAASSPTTVAAPSMGRPAPSRLLWQLNPQFDFVGTLPISRREIAWAWRSYRRMGRAGQRVDFDVDATIEDIFRHGVLIEPVMVPRRKNQARVLVLEDSGGSMVPFSHVTAMVMDSAQHAGLARVHIRYFHDVPSEVVYRDPQLVDPVPIDEALGPFVGAGILVYGDAGAARRTHDPRRVEQTTQVLERLRGTTPTVAWLNPVPAQRWPGTSAESIRVSAGVPMFPLDRPGLSAAINILRGYAT